MEGNKIVIFRGTTKTSMDIYKGTRPMPHPSRSKALYIFRNDI